MEVKLDSFLDRSVAARGRCWAHIYSWVIVLFLSRTHRGKPQVSRVCNILSWAALRGSHINATLRSVMVRNATFNFHALVFAALDTTLTHSLEWHDRVVLNEGMWDPDFRWWSILSLVAIFTEVLDFMVEGRLDHAAAVPWSLLLGRSTFLMKAACYRLPKSCTRLIINSKWARMFGRWYLRFKQLSISLLFLLSHLHFTRSIIIHLCVKLVLNLRSSFRIPAHSRFHECHILIACFWLERLLLLAIDVGISVSLRTIPFLLLFLGGMLSSDHVLEEVVRLQSRSYWGIGAPLHASCGSVIIDVIFYVLVILSLIGFTHLLILILTRCDIQWFTIYVIHVIAHIGRILNLQWLLFGMHSKIVIFIKQSGLICVAGETSLL